MRRHKFGQKSEQYSGEQALLFDEAVGAATWVGAGIILASTFYISHREAVLARKAATHAPSEAKAPGE